LSKAKADVRKVFEILNKHLSTRTYLVGERISFADITIASSLYHIYQLVAEPSFRKAFVNVNRWYLTVVNQPKVHEVFGDVVLADKAQIAPESSAAEQEVEKPKETKPKEAKPKKEEKPKPAPKEHDDEEEDETHDDEPKGKNPLDALPPPKMNMDEWKRMYSNNDTRATAMPWFWANFSEADYSLWFCRYLYNHELQQTFMTSNLIGGFLQRLDKLRKYVFGSMIIFGEEPAKLDIEGAWLVRGTEIPPELTTCDDYELYKWQRVNVGNEEEKKLLEDFWAWDGDFAARSTVWSGVELHPGYLSGKIFK